MVPLEDIDTQEKNTVSFSCKVNRMGVTLRWMKGGQQVSFSKRILYRADKDKHTLTIKDCTLADEGEYTAIAEDSKSTAELIISEAPTDFTAQLRDQTITEFDDAEFTCKLSKEKAEVKWYRDGREIREGPRYGCTRGCSMLTFSGCTIGCTMQTFSGCTMLTSSGSTTADSCSKFYLLLYQIYF